jgi:hypothetical protein
MNGTISKRSGLWAKEISFVQVRSTHRGPEICVGKWKKLEPTRVPVGSGSNFTVPIPVPVPKPEGYDQIGDTGAVLRNVFQRDATSHVSIKLFDERTMIPPIQSLRKQAALAASRGSRGKGNVRDAAVGLGGMRLAGSVPKPR